MGYNDPLERYDVLRKQNDDPMLENAITAVLEGMTLHSAHSVEYAQMVAQLETLYSLKEKPQRVSPDTLATIFANLAGIVMIVGHERLHVVTSKALQFIMKLR